MMNRPLDPRRRGGRTGFSRSEGLLLVIIAALAISIAVPLLDGTKRRDARSAAVFEAYRLHDALLAYHSEHGRFPSNTGPTEQRLDLRTLAPLIGPGQHSRAAAFNRHLNRGRMVAYLSASDSAEFWAVMRLEDAPDTVLVVAHSRSTPIPGWYDGVYRLVGDKLVPADLDG